MNLLIDKATAMKLFDSYKKHGNVTTHVPFPLGAGGIYKFYTKNLSFVYQGETGYIVTTKNKGNQSAIHELAKFLGTEVK